ncbi:MAG TPA: hypothetical protein DDY17_09025 [Syntrophaceae bacterium]|nr:hypothetical protein [Syntrophaceae bacterium]
MVLTRPNIKMTFDAFVDTNKDAARDLCNEYARCHLIENKIINLLSAIPAGQTRPAVARSLNIKTHAKGESLELVLDTMQNRKLIKLEGDHWTVPDNQHRVAGIIMGYIVHCETYEGEILFREDWYQTDPVENYGLWTNKK